MNSISIAEPRHDLLSEIVPSLETCGCSVALAALSGLLAERPLHAIHSIGEVANGSDREPRISFNNAMFGCNVPRIRSVSLSGYQALTFDFLAFFPACSETLLILELSNVELQWGNAYDDKDDTMIGEWTTETCGLDPASVSRHPGTMLSQR